jgi:hypothetical protein
LLGAAVARLDNISLELKMGLDDLLKHVQVVPLLPFCIIVGNHA